MRFSTSALLAGAFSSLLFLSACSSSDSGASKATVTADNYKDLAVAAAEAAKQASSIGTSNAPNFSSFLSKSSGANSSSIAAKLTRQIQRATLDCDLSGNVTVPDVFLLGNIAGSTLNNVTFQMNSCDDGDGSGAISGTFTFSGSVIGGDFSIVVSNASIPSEGLTNFSGTIVCTAAASAFGEPNCTFGDLSASNDFTGGIDNRSYSVSNASVTGNSVDGFTVSATVNDPDHGSIDFTATAITFNCSGGIPGSGTVTITGDNNTSATVTFDNCTEFTVSSGGLSDTFLWSLI